MLGKVFIHPLVLCSEFHLSHVLGEHGSIFSLHSHKITSWTCSVIEQLFLAVVTVPNSDDSCRLLHSIPIQQLPFANLLFSYSEFLSSSQNDSGLDFLKNLPQSALPLDHLIPVIRSSHATGVSNALTW